MELDGKYKIKDNRLVKIDTNEPIPDDEPVFIFRGRDKIAAAILNHYLWLCMCMPAEDRSASHLAGIDKQLRMFEAFKKEHPERMKYPGTTMCSKDGRIKNG